MSELKIVGKEVRGLTWMLSWVGSSKQHVRGYPTKLALARSLLLRLKMDESVTMGHASGRVSILGFDGSSVPLGCLIYLLL